MVKLACNFRLNLHDRANACSEATHERQTNAHGEATLTVKLNTYGKASAIMLGLRIWRCLIHGTTRCTWRSQRI